MAECLTRGTSDLRLGLLAAWVQVQSCLQTRNFTVIAQYWLVHQFVLQFTCFNLSEDVQVY